MLVLIKGPFCFVFPDESSEAPKYAISLAYMTPKARPAKMGKLAVALESSLGDVEFVFLFSTTSSERKSSAKDFALAVDRAAKAGEADIVRKVRRLCGDLLHDLGRMNILLTSCST
jgi:hypothetical protein